MSNERVRVILNPAAGGGVAMRNVAAIGETLRRYELRHEIVLTKAPGHAADLARSARTDGVDVVAVVGGDGSLNEVAQAYVGSDGEPIPGPDLALIPCGTGGDFKKTLGMSGALDEAIARIRHGTRRPIDMGILRVTSHGGDLRTMAFVNITSFGIGGQVDALVNAQRDAKQWLGGKGSFFVATLRAMASYKNASVRVSVDGRIWYEGPIFNVAIANGRFFGGGMMIAPHADASDGRFEVVALADLSRADVLRVSPKVYKGAHLSEHGVRVTHGVRVEAEAIHPWASVLADVDGEQPGKLPLRATVAKHALTFRC
jgi:YegS/Rv2252/BmrU family lipid kinase